MTLFSKYLLFVVLMFYKVTLHTELANPTSLLLWEIES